jgi:hypothetical protein
MIPKPLEPAVDSWLMISDHPYYPSVETCATEAEAMEAARKECEDMHNDDGTHPGLVYVAHVTAVASIRTHY